MNAAQVVEQPDERSPRLQVRWAGTLYLLTFIAGISAFLAHGTLGLAANLIAGACYVAVTVLFYVIFKPVSRSLSLLATLISLAGCVMTPLNLLHLSPLQVNPLVFFGFYCLLIGYLVFKSTFLPRILGVLLAFGGLGWLTFASPSLVKRLSPYNMLPGVLGEAALTVWLLVMGVNVQRWKERASA